MYASQQETNKTTAKKPEAEKDNSKPGLNYAEMLHEQSKCFQRQCAPSLQTGDAIQKKDDEEEPSCFNPKDFTWTANTENLALIDIAAILRKSFGIGLSFETNVKFAENLKEKNKLKFGLSDKIPEGNVIQIPSEALLNKQLYAPEGGSVKDNTREDKAAIDFSSNLSEIEFITKDIKKKLDELKDITEIYDAVYGAGFQLWKYCLEKTQKTKPESADHILYHGRNLIRSYIKSSKNELIKNDLDQITHLIYQLEQSSRGLSSAAFENKKAYKVLLSGFDPFFDKKYAKYLPKDYGNSNLSGQIAMKYNNKVINVNGRDVEFSSVVFPVRENDFKEGIVENFYKDQLNNIDMVINTGIAEQKFEIEESAYNEYESTFRDNNEMSRNTEELIKGGELSYDNNLITEEEFNKSPLKKKPNVIYDKMSKKKKAPAGGFYCNALSYRVSALKTKMKRTIPSGFIHLPISAYTDANREKHYQTFDKIVNEILKTNIK